MKMHFMLVLCAALALSVGIGTAAAGGNSDAAHACQQGGWQNLVRQDGTGFKNTGDCVSYAAQGGVLKAKSTCTTGSENFAGNAENSQPNTFSGGTIDTPYGFGGAILVEGQSWGGASAPGTHVLFTGWGANPFKLAFTNAVNSVNLETQSNKTTLVTHLTLTGYDASNNVVATDQGTDNFNSLVTPHISSTTNNIKSFTITTDDPNNGGLSYGLGFSNIAWACA
jgi:hypothetical protein